MSEKENWWDEIKEPQVYTIQDLFSHVNAVEDELKAELNEIKTVLNKLVMSSLDKSE